VLVHLHTKYSFTSQEIINLTVISLSLTGTYRLEIREATEVGFRSAHVAETGVRQHAGCRTLGSDACYPADSAEEGLSR